MDQYIWNQSVLSLVSQPLQAQLLSAGWDLKNDAKCPEGVLNPERYDNLPVSMHSRDCM